jgi:hypothetical protein
MKYSSSSLGNTVEAAEDASLRLIRANMQIFEIAVYPAAIALSNLALMLAVSVKLSRLLILPILVDSSFDE